MRKYIAEFLLSIVDPQLHRELCVRRHKRRLAKRLAGPRLPALPVGEQVHDISYVKHAPDWV